MFTPVPPPGLTSSPVASYAVRFEVRDDGRAMAARHGIELPAALARAVDKRVCEFVAGRLCAREALRMLGVIHPPPIGVRPDRGPDWPAGTVGSITHSTGWAWAAAARAADRIGLGIDSETMPADAMAREIMPVVLDAGETERLFQSVAPRWGEAAAVALGLSAKECVYKCLSGTVGRVLDFNDARVADVDPAAGAFRLRLVAEDAAACVPGGILSGRFVVQPPRVHCALER